MVLLRYDKGSLLIQGEVGTPYGQWDHRVGAFRAMAIYYREVLAYLERSRMVYRDEAANPPPVPSLSCRVELRPYQKTALDAWFDAGGRGVIVLPTAAGKTFVALKAIEMLNVATLVVVPTLDLLDQWRKLLSNQFETEVGAYGGGDDRLEPLTVSTYDSQIAEMYIAPYRMGLTATYEREDGGHYDLPRLVGGPVYQLEVDALAGKHLSPYTHEKILVDLTPDEQKLYKREYDFFANYLRRKRVVLRSPEDFRRFIMRTGSDPEAREALLARNKALKTALNSEAKIKGLGEFLDVYGQEKILIFTRYNQLVYRISRRFLIPAVTYQTPREERKEILEKFKAGEYRAVVTSQVLDEGVDVPDASIGFILSGTGSSREYIQRLGRILRKRRGKQAKLIEIVARETVETRISQRRHR
jgi:superfamily II DNA or RNA helicase